MTEQTIISPTLSDLAFFELSGKLTGGLSWLDNCFGRAYFVNDKDGRTYPGALKNASSGIKYFKLFPDEGLGNFGFFLMDDPSDVLDFERHATTRISQDFALILWVDLRKAYPDDWQQRTVEHVKAEVIQLLGSTSLQNSKGLSITSITDRPDRIYSEFNYQQVNNQSLMRPYVGVRLNCSFLIEITC